MPLLNLIEQLVSLQSALFVEAFRPVLLGVGAFRSIAWHSTPDGDICFSLLQILFRELPSLSCRAVMQPGASWTGACSTALHHGSRNGSQMGGSLRSFSSPCANGWMSIGPSRCRLDAPSSTPFQNALQYRLVQHLLRGVWEFSLTNAPPHPPPPDTRVARPTVYLPTSTLAVPTFLASQLSSVSAHP